MLNIRTRIQTDLKPSKQIQSRIRSENIRTIFIHTRGRREGQTRSTADHLILKKKQIIFSKKRRRQEEDQRVWTLPSPVPTQQCRVPDIALYAAPPPRIVAC
jgi:hypothetical protein